MELCNMLKHSKKKLKPHQGKMLKAAIAKSPFTIKYVAEKLNKEYSTLFKWFEKDELDIGNFYKVGVIINHDFSGEIEGINSLVNEEEVPYNRLDLNQCMKENDRLRIKYIELLERHNSLLERVSTAN